MATLIQRGGISKVSPGDVLKLCCADDAEDRALAAAGGLVMQYAIARSRDDVLSPGVGWLSRPLPPGSAACEFTLGDTAGRWFICVRAVDVSDATFPVASPCSAEYEFRVEGIACPPHAGPSI